MWEFENSGCVTVKYLVKLCNQRHEQNPRREIPTITLHNATEFVRNVSEIDQQLKQHISPRGMPTRATQTYQLIFTTTVQLNHEPSGFCTNLT